MPTVPQPYVYPISNIIGGYFTGESSDHLTGLILTQLALVGNPTISSDGIDVVITFDADLSTEDKATLDSLVDHANDLFIITKDGGVTDLGNPATVSVNAGLSSATTITLQYKTGTGANFNGFGDTVTLSAPIMTIDKVSGTFNGTGKFQFVIGAELNRGTVQIEISTDTSMPKKSLIAEWK